MNKENKKIKNIALSDDCIKYFSHQAIEHGTVFKLHIEKILEDMARKGGRKKTT